MKAISLLFLASASLLGWHCHSATDQTTLTERDSVTAADIHPLFMPDIYSDQQLASFLDSLVEEGPKEWEKLATEDSEKDFDSLVWNGRHGVDPFVLLPFRKAFKEKKIPTEFAKKWIPALDSEWLAMDYIPLNLHYSELDNRIFSLGDDASMKWDATLYFFSNKGVLAFRKLSHRYGLDEIESFTGPNGEEIVHFRANYESGTGIWRWNEYYYAFTQDTVIPVFNHLQLSNLSQFSTRSWWWETSIESQRPFRLKVVARISLPDTAAEPAYFYQDSTIVQPVWNPARYHYEWPSQMPNWSSTRMLSFVHGQSDPYLFMIGFAPELKAALVSADPEVKRLVRNYLQYTVYSLRHPMEATAEE